MNKPAQKTQIFRKTLCDLCPKYGQSLLEWRRKMKRALSFAMLVALVFPFPVAVFGRQSAEEITKDKILGNGQEWKDKYDKYDPPADILSALKSKVDEHMKIDVYLGLWCPDSRNNVPVFLKIMDGLGVEILIRYLAVPRKANRTDKYYVESMDVEKVPTFIFYRDGKEIGRIKENPKTSMIDDMLDIVYK